MPSSGPSSAPAPNPAVTAVAPGLAGALAAMICAIVVIPNPALATSLCVAAVAAFLGLLYATTGRSGGGAPPKEAGGGAGANAGLFSVLFLCLFGGVCYLSLAAGSSMLYRGVFVVVSLPLVIPSCALLALSLLPGDARLSSSTPENQAAGNAPAPLISVILATRNEPFDVVKMTLESVLALEYPADRLELIITDNSDTTHPDLAPMKAWLEELSLQRSVRFLHRDGKDGAKARNLDLALAAATGEHVLLVDADSTFTPGSLRAAVAHLAAHPRTGYVQFRINTSNWQRNTFTFCAPYMSDVLIRSIEERRSTIGFAFNGGHNVVWRRATLDEIAPFERYFDGALAQTEDYSASIRAALAGWRCEVLGIDSGEWAPFDMGSYLKQWYRWGYGAQQGVLYYARSVIGSEQMSYGAKLGLLFAFLHFLTPTFTVAGSLWLSAVTLLGAGAPTGPGCVAFGLLTGSLAMLVLYLRFPRSHPGASLPARVGGMLAAAVVLFSLTTVITMLSLFANLTGRQMVWTVTAKK